MCDGAVDLIDGRDEYLILAPTGPSILLIAFLTSGRLKFARVLIYSNCRIVGVSFRNYRPAGWNIILQRVKS